MGRETQCQLCPLQKEAKGIEHFLWQLCAQRAQGRFGGLVVLGGRRWGGWLRWRRLTTCFLRPGVSTLL